MSTRTAPSGERGDRSVEDRGRKSGFLRAMSRKKSVHKSVAKGEETADAEKSLSRGKSLSRTLSRGLSKRRSFCEKITRSKDEPKFGSRAKTGPVSLKAKEQVLLKYPGLAIQEATAGDRAEELVYHGANSIRAEVIDMNCMLVVMQDNRKMLSYKAVERFFDWIPLFSVYLERYMAVEEDLVVRWVESKGAALRGELRPSARMVMRGKIQREVQEVQEVQDLFVAHVPPGERLGRLLEACDVLTRDVVELVSLVTGRLPGVMKERCGAKEMEKGRTRVVKHVVQHVGYQDFLAVYTRWMRAADLLAWKTTVLLPCDFKFFSYATWERDMDGAHYQIAAQFGEMLQRENAADEEANRQMKEDFERGQMARQQMDPLRGLDVDGLAVEVAEEEEYDEEEERAEGNEQ